MHKIKKTMVLSAIYICILFTIGSSLNPFEKRMFSFHDATQAARIQQMALNIQNGKIPPRIAPELSFNLGFPVFNFYAPAAYWITTGLHLLGMPIAMALKFSFLLSILFAFTAMFLLLRAFFGFLPSVLGSTAYISSLWFAIEIFVRGNLAETWFLAFFPMSLYLLIKSSRKELSPWTFALTVIVLSLTFTTHNVLSLLSLVLFFFFILPLKKKKRGVLAILLALGLASYFLVPAVFESPLTYASEIAKKTDYRDHFLCLSQIWASPKWEFGGSAAGCVEDGMPFVLGKIHITLTVLGSGLYLFLLLKKRKWEQFEFTSLFFLILGFGAVFLTTYQSAFVWELFKPLLSLFQFPWRFLVFAMVAIAYFSAFLFHTLSKGKVKVFMSLLAITTIVFLLFTSKKFFSIPWMMSYDEYGQAYLAKGYVSRTVAFNMAEYLPKSASYTYWRGFDSQIHPGKDMDIDVTEHMPVEVANNEEFKVLSNGYYSKEISVSKPTNVTINIHYFPFWNIYVNNKKIIPDTFDKLGRPIIHTSQPSIIHVVYHETLWELFGDIGTLCTWVFIIMLVVNKSLWKKLTQYLK